MSLWERAQVQKVLRHQVISAVVLISRAGLYIAVTRPIVWLSIGIFCTRSKLG
jgi:hypothetical protein